MSEKDAVGHGYKVAVHPEDVDHLVKKWRTHTGEGTDCSTEVRYRRYDDVYRWHLTRACPLRDKNGNILKWYGTSTDIHDLVMARITDNRKKEQVLAVLAHAEVNLFAMDKNRIVTMTEGGLVWEAGDGSGSQKCKEGFSVGRIAIDMAQRTQTGEIPGR